MDIVYRKYIKNKNAIKSNKNAIKSNKNAIKINKT